MPTRDHAPLGSPCWTDLWTSDVEGSRRFYSELLGWEAQEPSPEFGGYFMFTRNGAQSPGGWVTWTRCAPTTPGRCTSASTTSRERPRRPLRRARGTCFPRRRWRISASRPCLSTRPAQRSAPGSPAGSPASRSSTNTARPPGSSSSPGTTPAPSLSTATSSAGTRPTSRTAMSSATRSCATPTARESSPGSWTPASSLPEGVGSHWSVYWAVDDADVVAAQAEALGGSVVAAPKDTPYGRFATLSDPAGGAVQAAGYEHLDPHGAPSLGRMISGGVSGSAVESARPPPTAAMHSAAASPTV